MRGEPAESWADRDNEEYLVSSHGRGADMMFTEDEPYPVRSEPVPMDFQAPLHTPYGTAERTYDDFWGHKNPLLERRNLLPSYAIAENEWDRNPRECGKQISEKTLNPYESESSFNSALGADVARSIDTKSASVTQYMRFYQTDNPTAWGADPVIGGSSGGGVPRLGPYIGKSGSDKPSWTPGYVPPAGGLSAPPVESEMTLPGATRSNRNHEEFGNVTGGDAVASYGDEFVNPQIGGRPSLLATDYEYWGHRNGGGLVSGGADWEAGGGVDRTLWNPNDGARYRYLPNQDGANDPLSVNGPVSMGPSLDLTPKIGGRPNQKIDFDRVLAGGTTSGVGSGLTHNPQDGGRMTRIMNWENIGSGGAANGVGSGLTHNPQDGGRMTRIMNWENMGSGGATNGVGSGLTHNPQDGGRMTRIINWENIGSGGATSGMGSDLTHNPQAGGRASRLINFDVVLPGGLSSGVGSSLENNPRDGGRVSMLKNWQILNPGGLASGVSGVGISNIIGGEHVTRTEGCVGYLPPGGSLNQDYGGGDVSFGLEVSPRMPREGTTSIMIPGTSGGRGPNLVPERFITLPNTRRNGEGMYDDSPDPLLQVSARSLLGAKALLDFSQKNIDDLAFSVPCI